MKLYLLLAIVVCQSCNYCSHAEYDSLVEFADRGPPAGWANLSPEDALPPESALSDDFEWSPWAAVAAVKRSAKADIQTRRRSALDKNFMRFGRADRDMVRYERAPNLMRFGRPDRNFLRFGRNGLPGAEDANLSKQYATSTEQLEQPDEGAANKRNGAGGGASEEVMDGTGLSESGEQIKPKQLVYYRRDSPKNLMRFGKRRPAGASGYMRFGRANLMRFGRRSDEPALFGRTVRGGPSNLMRFGRAGNLMRFGRSGAGASVAPTSTDGNGTSSQPAVRDGAHSSQALRGTPPLPEPSLPASLLELLDGSVLMQGMAKEQQRLALLDAIGAGEEASRVLPDEQLPVYVVKK